MFAVPKYSQPLEDLRKQRNVEGLFQHNLVKVDPKNKVATFKNLADGANGALVEREFGFLRKLSSIPLVPCPFFRIKYFCTFPSFKDA